MPQKLAAPCAKLLLMGNIHVYWKITIEHLITQHYVIFARLRNQLCKNTVLVIEDEKDILYIIAKAMRSYGIFDVDDFTEPLKALEHFKNHMTDYSVVVSDIRMPGMSGIEFLNEIKKIRPEIPLVAMTAYDILDDEIIDQLPSLTKGEIVHKPFKFLSVCDVVKKQLHIALRTIF